MFYYSPMEKGVLQRYLDAAAKTNDPNLRWQLQKEDIRQNYYARQERQQLKEEITNDVLSRLRLELDIAPTLQQIKDLQQALDNLGK